MQPFQRQDYVKGEERSGASKAVQEQTEDSSLIQSLYDTISKLNIQQTPVTRQDEEAEAEEWKESNERNFSMPSSQGFGFSRIVLMHERKEVFTDQGEWKDNEAKEDQRNDVRLNRSRAFDGNLKENKNKAKQAEEQDGAKLRPDN
ncbi:hypothetical protein GUITHDRAFT_121804 [Guillardia theta CCMP2712]|uniref:Uncharacterized protein n=1 Tax=Guillardia theta (strain CCMP2712) TaxID=905079 RepID=L1I7H1_GUITC|nr:hypothetical protein GUITHDRAFT_121804 [Guillardia theta CCMP2712]EKX32037.1 hypothetical protein GUITHDRAFT_121804 [Guillardia theta CCMP2712]|eukprot:XP_005819017.1 hypothetical protein GUITHDRAFT_121804 [Guillardia theta CCMP2712]